MLVNTAATQVIINTVGGDDILNADEVEIDQTLSGRVVNAEAGQSVTVSLGGKIIPAPLMATALGRSISRQQI
nr:hypothetical protein [Budvicia aquatica]